MNAKAKKTTSISISTIVGVMAIYTFLSDTQFPMVWASEFEEYKVEQNEKHNELKGNINTILILSVEAEIVRLEDKIDRGMADSADKTRLLEMRRKLLKLNS